jgi:hypothetical protein
MSPPASQIKLGRRPRRSKRLGLSVAVRVYGKDISGETFRELTRTLSVDANGGLLALAATVQEGQTILVENRNTREEQECRVVHVGSAQDGKWAVGIAFAHVAVEFWRISFPPPISRRLPDARD